MLFSDKRKPSSKNMTLDHMFIKAMEDVLDSASLLCGIIREKEDSMMGNIKLMDTDLINQLREERMFRMIAIENIEKDKAWFDYDNHETLVKLQISESIIAQQTTELIYDLNNINLKKDASKYSATNLDEKISNLNSQRTFKESKINLSGDKWDIVEVSSDNRDILKSKSSSAVSDKDLKGKIFHKEANVFRNNLLTVDYKNMLLKPSKSKVIE